MASSSTTLATVSSSTSTSTSSSSPSSKPAGNETSCGFTSFNTTGLNGPICLASIPPDFFNISSCAQTPSDIRRCGAHNQLFESKYHNNNNISDVQNQTFTCIDDLLQSTARTSKSFSISCLNYKDGVHVNGANGIASTRSYDAAMGVWALILVVGWSLNMI